MIGLKALGDGKIAGYLIRYSSRYDVDLDGDFFPDHNTCDYAIEEGSTVPMYFEHGGDPDVGTKRLARGVLSLKPKGIQVKAQLDMMDEYGRAIYELVVEKTLGLSSGALSHLVRRFEYPNGAKMIISWPIGEGSLVTCMAEPRLRCDPVKAVAYAYQSHMVLATQSARLRHHRLVQKVRANGVRV